MNHTFGNLIYRVFFIISFILLILAIWERINQFYGYTFTWLQYQPGQLLQFSAIFMIFTIGLLLRQLRDQMRSGNQ
jgi:hypothetical protein